MAACLALARELSAGHALDARRGRLAPRGLDFVLEVAGNPDMEGLGAEVLAPRGTLAPIARPGRAAA